MPAPKQINPTSLRSRLRLYFMTNPGNHRPLDVATALNAPARTVANECARLARSGELARARPPGSAAMGPGVTYTLAKPRKG